MANTGYKWTAWGPMEKGAGDWTADSIPNGNTETGDVTTLDLQAGCEVGIALTAGAGAITGECTVYVLGTADGTNYEEPTIGSPFAFNITPVESDTVYKRFMVDPASYGTFKVAVFNDSGQAISVTAKFRTADWPVAS